MKTKTTLRILFFFLAFVSVSFTDPEPYLAKRISDADFRYEFYTTDKKINPKKDKTYYWFKGGSVHSAQAGIAGILLHGKYTKTFHSNQLAEQGEFENGLKKGTWKSWYPNGTVETTQYWQDGSRGGSFYHYSIAGEVLESGNFKKDKKHGKWIDFVKKDTAVYKKGVIFVKKPKLTKEEKIKLKEENAKLKEENKKASEAEKLAKKASKETKALEKANKKTIKEQEQQNKKATENKSDKPRFFKKLFSKKEPK